MSRSNPRDGQPNPSTRWHEWQGEIGEVRYYDKDAKKNISLGADFTFLLLDQLACITGWDDASDSGIYSNEVRDTRADMLIVKSFKGGILAEGTYKAIKDRVNSAGGNFTANLYIAYKRGAELAIGSLKLKGAALFAWSEFAKAHRRELLSKAVKITGYTEGKKGRIVYRVPTFAVIECSAETDQIAKGLDAELQAYLDGYFARTTTARVESPRHVADEEVEPPPPTDQDAPPLTDDDIPF